MPKTDHLLHKPDSAGGATCAKIRNAAIKFEELMDENCPPSRELSLAKTKLEEARMWAIKAIVMQFPSVPLDTPTHPEIPADATIHPDGMSNPDERAASFDEHRKG